jgi:hypothetical protein
MSAGGDPRVAIVDRLLEAIPPPPELGEMDIEVVLVAFSAMCERYDAVVTTITAPISLTKPRSIELENRMAELAERQRAWASMVSLARAQVSVQLGGARKLRRYETQSP